jgi:hypothetical protein
MKSCLMKSVVKLTMSVSCSRLVCQTTSTCIQRNLSVTEDNPVPTGSVINRIHCKTNKYNKYGMLSTQKFSSLSQTLSIYFHTQLYNYTYMRAHTIRPASSHSFVTPCNRSVLPVCTVARRISLTRVRRNTCTLSCKAMARTIYVCYGFTFRRCEMPDFAHKQRNENNGQAAT